MDTAVIAAIFARSALVDCLSRHDYDSAEATLRQWSRDTQPASGSRFAGLSLDDSLRVFRSGTVGNYDFARSFVCSVCARQLLHPVMFLCGHAACRTCAAREVFTRAKCAHCQVVCTLPRGYQTDVVLRVLEKQRPAWLCDVDSRAEDHTLDAVLDMLSTWLNTRTLSAEAPRVVLQLPNGARLQLQLALASTWVLHVWFIYDATTLTPLQVALAATLTTQAAHEQALLQRLHASAKLHQTPQRFVVEAAFTAQNTSAQTLRLDFYAVHSWAATQWQKVGVGDH